MFLFFYFFFIQKPELKHREFESKLLLLSPDVTLSQFTLFVWATCRYSLLNTSYFFKEMLPVDSLAKHTHQQML